MEKRLARMHVGDILMIALSVTATWGILAFVLREVLALTGDGRVKIVLYVSALSAGVFVTGAFIALFGHLRRNRATLYREDIEHRLAREAGGQTP